jgi:dimethylamine monooxygenase subunit C
MSHEELKFNKGKRKYLFCTDQQGAESLHLLVQQTIEANVQYDFLMIEDQHDSFLNDWFTQQKMGTYLYISGRWKFVKRVKNLALSAGFTQYEMQVKVLESISKRIICCKCHGVNEIDDEVHITCRHCRLYLEVSTHYSRRLDGYLGYYSIK